jgi:hypothetical protein
MVCYSCHLFNKHTIVFNQKNSVSKPLIPPKDCYKVKIYALGKLTCPTKLKIIMDEKDDAFLHTLNLEGEYSKKEIYDGDWYQNSLQLRMEDTECLKGEFKIIVEFFG